MVEKLRKARSNGSPLFVWIAENGGDPNVIELCQVIVELEQHGLNKEALDCAYQYLHSLPMDEQSKSISKFPKDWADIVIAGLKERYGKPAASTMNENSKMFDQHHARHAITVEETSLEEFMSHVEAGKSQNGGT